MMENEQFYDLLKGVGIDVNKYDSEGEVDIKYAAIRDEIYEEMEHRAMVVAVGRSDEESLLNYQAYFAKQADKWFETLRLEAISRPLTEYIPTREELETEAQSRAEQDLERAVSFQDAMLEITIEIAYWQRNGGIEDAENTVRNMLTKTLADFDIDIDNIDPAEEAFIDLFSFMVATPDEE